jgi:hypothetical protein
VVEAVGGYLVEVEVEDYLVVEAVEGYLVVVAVNDE